MIKCGGEWFPQTCMLLEAAVFLDMVIVPHENVIIFYSYEKIQALLILYSIAKIYFNSTLFSCHHYYYVLHVQNAATSVRENTPSGLIIGMFKSMYPGAKL